MIFALRTGPDALTYGFGSDNDEKNLAAHENVVEGRYSKYFPHQVKIDTHADSGETFEIVMNSQGFRGKEFSEQKAAGVIRVVTLGASSTFGYHSLDDETYPVVLQELLNERCEQRRFEVINLAIPHLDSGQILALLVDAALPLDPDIVTFYEGVNDSQGGIWRSPIAPSLPMRVRLLIRKKSLAAAFVRDVMRGEDLFGADAIDNEIATRSAGFVGNLEKILAELRMRGIAFFPATQQAKSSLFDPEETRGITYAEEVQTIRTHLARDGTLRWAEKNLLVHNGLMESLRAWTEENDVPLVDVIAALDDRRDALVSWVHLTPEGNRIIAGAFSDRIVEATCE